MHISDGVVGAPVVVAGAALALGMCGLAARNVRDEEIPRIALFTGAFFIASQIRFPWGFTSVHLVFTGLIGAVLGCRAFLAFTVGLALQALLTGHGGITTIGVNACIFGFPALMVYKLFVWIRSRGEQWVFVGGVVAGAAGVILSGLFWAVVVMSAGEPLIPVAEFVFVLHLPVAILEGIVTGFCVRYLSLGRPELLQESES